MASDQGQNQNEPDTHEQRVHALFMEAIELPEEERTAFIEARCGEDTELADQLEQLVSAHEDSTKRTVRDASRRGTTGVLEPGYRFDDFEILQLIGKGGNGEVYLAQQSGSISRQVALKVIKLGMDTQDVIKRFESERQTLATMKHQNIAAVYEAGSTPEGRPYFAMEYVRGEPITKYCNRNTLDTAARLELFAILCDAVQHAHDKGFIHRDLKPGNILVKIDNLDKPEPVVIDFGIAKAINPDLVNRRFVTEMGKMPGTPEYMSPEQAEGSQAGIDVRSDVYSLGVILYELLTGTLPFDSKALRSSEKEMQRILREDDPPKPSTQLGTTVSKHATKIAKNRKTDIEALKNALRRELEWIPLKALRKERTERYESPGALGKDVRRYLAGEALEAGPESALYRCKKIVRRNKGPFTAAALIALALVAGIIGTTIFAVQAGSERAEADRQRDNAEEQRDLATQKTEEALESKELAQAQTALAEQQRDQAEQERKRTEEVMALLTTSLMESTRSDMSTVLQSELDQYGLLDDEDRSALNIAAPNIANELTQKFTIDPVRRKLQDRQPLTKAQLLETMAFLSRLQGDYEKGEELQLEAWNLFSENLGTNDRKTLLARSRYGWGQYLQGNDQEATETFRSIHEQQTDLFGPEDPETLATQVNLIIALLGEPDDPDTANIDAAESNLDELTLRIENASPPLRTLLQMTAEISLDMAKLSRPGSEPPNLSAAADSIERKVDQLLQAEVDLIESGEGLPNGIAGALSDDQSYKYERERFTGSFAAIFSFLGLASEFQAVEAELQKDSDHTPENPDELKTLSETFFDHLKQLTSSRMCEDEDAKGLLFSFILMGAATAPYDPSDALDSSQIRLESFYASDLRMQVREHFLTYCRVCAEEIDPDALDEMMSLLDLEYAESVFSTLHESILRSNNGVEDARSLQVLHMHAVYLLRFSAPDDHERALSYSTRALEGRRVVLGNTDPDTLKTIGLLAFLLQSQDKNDEALPYFTEGFESSRSVLGDEHQDTLRTAFYYTESLQKLNRFIKARDLAEFCIRGYAKSMGPSHAFTMASINMNIEIHDALHSQDPTAGHDAKAQQMRRGNIANILSTPNQGQYVEP